MLTDYTAPQDMLGAQGLLQRLTTRVVERILEAELPAHLGYAPHVRHGTEEQNARNGKGQKTVQTDTGPLDLVVPRDRNGRFAPQRGPKRPRRLEGFDDKVVSLEARGLSTRDRQGHLAALDGTAVSPTRISSSTDAVFDEVRPWQARPLAAVYPMLYVDAFLVTSREAGAVQTKAVSLALGVTLDGEKARLGWWLSASEGAPCWLAVCPALHTRGVTDCCMACVDGLQGLPEAREAVLAHPQVPLCLVHKVRRGCHPAACRRLGQPYLSAL